MKFIKINLIFCFVFSYNISCSQNTKVLQAIAEDFSTFVFDVEKHPGYSSNENFISAIKAKFNYRDTFMMQSIAKLRFKNEMNFDSIIALVSKFSINYFWENYYEKYVSNIDSSFLKFSNFFYTKTAKCFDQKYDDKMYASDIYALMQKCELEINYDSAIKKELLSLTKFTKNIENAFANKRFAFYIKFSVAYRKYLLDFFENTAIEQLSYLVSSSEGLFGYFNQIYKDYKFKSFEDVLIVIPSYKKYSADLQKLALFKKEYSNMYNLVLNPNGDWIYSCSFGRDNFDKLISKKISFQYTFKNLSTKPIVTSFKVLKNETLNIDKNTPVPPPFAPLKSF